MKTKRRMTALAVAASSIMLISACGSTNDKSAGSGKKVSIDVGGGHVIKTNGKPLSIAYFAIGSNNSYLKANLDEAKKTAMRLHVKLDIFDGNFDPATQTNQMQTALENKKYNAWIVQPASGVTECNIATKQAPAANILVQDLDSTFCGLDLKEGADLKAPGLLNFVGGNETVSAWSALWQKAVDDNPGPQRVGVLVGPQLNSITRAFLKAMKNTAPSNWKIINPVYTDYSVPDAQAKAAPLIQANKDLTILMSAYTNITKGGVAALRASGDLGKVKIYEGGGTVTGVKYVEDGITQATLARYSRSPIRYSIEAVVDAWAGKKVPAFTNNDGHADEVGRPAGAPVFVVTKENAKNYHPEND